MVDGGLRRILPALLVAVLAPVAHVAPAQAAPAEPVVDQGTVLPFASDKATTGLLAASPHYVMHARQQWDENSFGAATILRMDGSEVRRVPLSQDDAYAGPTLVDDAYLQFDNSSRPRVGVTVRSVETGALLWTQSIASMSNGWPVHVDDEWMMYDVIGATTGHNTLHIRRGNGVEVVVDKVFPDQPRWIGGDSDTAFFEVFGTPYAVDTASGALDSSVFDHAGTTLLGVSTQNLIGRRLAPGSGTSYIFTSRDRATGVERDSAPFVPDFVAEDYLPFGDQIAVRTSDALHLLDFAAGALGPVLYDGVAGAEPTGDETIVLATATGATGRLAKAAQGESPAVIADFAPLGEQAYSLGLSGDRVAASWMSTQLGVWTRSTEADGTWEQTYPTAILPPWSGDLSFALAGDVVLAESEGHDRYLASWPGGSREFAAGWTELGRNGTYLIREGREVQDTRTGEVVRSWTDGPRSLDGDWLWTSSDNTGRIVGSDLTGTRSDRVVELGADCRGTVPQVWERWILAACWDQMKVFDRTGVLPPRVLSSDPTSLGRGSLGNGFAMNVERVPSGPGQDVPRLQVTDLLTGEVRLYGPMAGQTFSQPGYDFVANDDGSPEMAFTDSTLQVRHVRLDWLASAGQAHSDVIAPTVVDRPTLAPFPMVEGPVDLGLSWTFTDPSTDGVPASGVTTYDVRRRSSAPQSPWDSPEEWKGLSTAAVSARLEPGSGSCFAARAHDGAGNVSPWSPASCQTLDTSAPMLGSAPAIATYRATSLDAEVPLAWSFTDPQTASASSGLATYDVRRNHGEESSWTYPDSWQARTSPEVTAELAAGSRSCFSARARDAVGNTSAWSEPVCQLLDGDAPAATSTPSLPARVASTSAVPVQLTWTYQEGAPTTTTPSGLGSYDVRRSDLAQDSWTQPTSWTGIPAASVQDEIASGTGRCWQARARDLAGNVSAWSQAICQRVDGAVPVMRASTGSPAWLTRTPSPVTFSVVAADDDRIASYELQTRITPRGVARRAWVTVVGASPRGTLTTAALPGGTEGCVRARARDAAGNVSSWSAERCSTVPVNDTSLTYHGKAARSHASVAINGNYVTLRRQGSTATSPRLSGRTIGVWLLRGRGLGKLDVYAGGRRVARISCAATSTRRALATIAVPRGFTGSVKLVNVTKAPTRIDAISTQR